MNPMDPTFAQLFAAEWIAAWNSHDLDRILSHYTEDFEMNSPFIVQYMGEPSGRLARKDKVRAYWSLGLSRNPNLHFTLLDLHVGANSIVIHYHNQPLGRAVSEVLFFDPAGKVFRAAAHYATVKG